MRRTVKFGLVAVFRVAMVSSGWAASERKTDFKGSQLNAAYLKGDYRAKADYFILIQDASWSVFWHDKFSQGRDLANQVNYTMPKMNLKSGIYTFGESRLLFGPTVRKVGASTPTRAAISRAPCARSSRVTAAAGFTRLSMPLTKISRTSRPAACRC